MIFYYHPINFLGELVEESNNKDVLNYTKSEEMWGPTK